MHKQQKSFGWSEYFSYPCWKQASLVWNCLSHIPYFDHFDWFPWKIWHWVSLSKMNVDDVCQGSLSFCWYWHSHNLLLAASLHATHISHTLRDCSKSIILSITEMLSIEKHHQPVKKWIPIICKHEFRFHRLPWSSPFGLLGPSWHKPFLSLAR